MNNMDKQVSFDEEPLILVDKSGRHVGSKPKLECHLGEGILHKAFSVFIFNSNWEVLLQKRSAGKMLWPSYWSNSCCSHPRLNEDEVPAAHRRIYEELGISVSGLEKHFDFEYQAAFKDVGSEWEYCSVFTAYSNEKVKTNRTEVEDIKWVGIDQLTDMLSAETEKFTPWIKLEWAQLLPVLKSQQTRQINP